mmetsp:Transcript_42990/g.71678  ORF Transcript_42990/g.71678 Transcript_42990/m.71678 type:complete len:411 (-) Transcript_42990:439-1671(-)
MRIVRSIIAHLSPGRREKRRWRKMQTVFKLDKPRSTWCLQLSVVALCAVLFIYTYSTTLSESPLTPSSPQHLHVLVTGCAGFVGSHASLRLLEDGHAVTCVDNFSRGNIGAVRVVKNAAAPGRFRFVELDLGNYRAVEEVFDNSNADLVMHFAAVAYVGESVANPVQYYDNITSNTINVIKAMKAASINKLIYSSTCATYGNPDKLPITEQTPTHPINPYGKAKLAAEQVVRDYAASTPQFTAAVLRYFNVYGADPAGRLGEFPRPELRAQGRISGACFDAALGEIPSLTVYGTQFPTPDGTCIRDYIHVTDLVDAHVTVTAHLRNPPALYNVGTGRGYSVKQFVDTCRKVTGVDIAVVEQALPRAGDYAEVFADTSLIRRELNWTARFVDLSEGMATAWKWRKEHPHGY